jgi:uncharacterized membrane protein
VSDFVPLFLTVHILTAIVAFGPNFAMPFIALMAAEEPQHGLFALRLSERIGRRLVLPLALTMPISGSLLALGEGINPLVSHWLLGGIVLYVVTVGYAVTVQRRTVSRMIEIASHMSAGGPALAAGPGAELARPVAAAPAAPDAVAAKASRYANPGAEMAALGVRARNGGFFLMAMIFIIVSLMAGKPAI